VTPYATLAPLYDALLGDHFFPQLRRVFEWLVRRHNTRFASAADVACGTGTFVRYLCESGVPIVYGVDRSPEMLLAAIQKNPGSGAHFLCQDFTTLQLPRAVDLITCHFDSLNYLLTTGDLLRAFRRFHANLNRAGHVIFDMITDQRRWQDVWPRVERMTGPGVTLTRVTRWDPRHSIQTAIVSVSRNGRSHQEIHVQRGYPITMVISLLMEARFTLFGTHDFQPLGPARPWTPRAVYVARAV
jgi:SAM-dependent methyltransferase